MTHRRRINLYSLQAPILKAILSSIASVFSYKFSDFPFAVRCCAPKIRFPIRRRWRLLKKKNQKIVY